jgi:hypothetical protein
MRRSRALLGALLSTAILCGAAVSCSDSNDDVVGQACNVMVRECGAHTSVGGCIDSAGDLPADCLDCISHHGADQGCDYATCQRSPSGCRLPVELLRP